MFDLAQEMDRDLISSDDNLEPLTQTHRHENQLIDKRIYVDIYDDNRFPRSIWTQHSAGILEFEFQYNESTISYCVEKQKNQNRKFFIKIDTLTYIGPRGEAHETFENWMMWLEATPFTDEIPSLVIECHTINDEVDECLRDISYERNWEIVDEEILWIIYP